MGLGRRFMHVLHVFLLYSMLSLLLLGCTYVDSSTSSSGAGSKISNGNSVGVGGDGASVSTSTTAHIPSCASLESISSGDEQKCQTSGSKPVELSIYRAVAGGILKQCDVYPQTGCDFKGVEQYAMKGKHTPTPCVYLLSYVCTHRHMWTHG